MIENQLNKRSRPCKICLQLPLMIGCENDFMFHDVENSEKMTIPKVNLNRCFKGQKVVTFHFQVFEGYTKICQFNSYNPVTAPEFKELINMIETSGLLTLKALKSSKDSISSQMVSLNVQVTEIDKACRENHTLARVLDNGARPLLKKTKL